MGVSIYELYFCKIMVYLAIHAHGVPLLSLGFSFRLVVPVSFERALFMMHFCEHFLIL